ncbi:beta arrestin 1 [Trichuris trichiura]|uniref:Beta arrestin 1 n=1 Tax=Trichuris trichiura TaxID=36087 RepID=A0A077YZN5_TRITR|nr:beta arrestin 1 [Trichuris trichiura]
MGTRVFKKSSPSGKFVLLLLKILADSDRTELRRQLYFHLQITTYLGKRDFIDHLTHVDVIDGMVLIDQSIIDDCQCVVVTLHSAFCYGREDLDVLGLQFRKDLLLEHVNVYPPDPRFNGRKLTRLQERLRYKLGLLALPFWFELTPSTASSVTLQPTPDDSAKPCGVDYELKTYVTNNSQAKPKKQDSVRLAIRKLTCVPISLYSCQPSFELSKDFIMSAGLLHVEASLDKELYYHGESIFVNVYIQNNSNKTVKKIKIIVVQRAAICLFSTATYQCEVAKLESSEGFPLGIGGTLTKVYSLCPLLANNRDKRGLALDGKLKHEDTNLASSTIVTNEIPRENLGIIVEYRVRVRLTLSGALSGELCGELPFILTRPDLDARIEQPDVRKDIPPPPVEVDLIQLDAEEDKTMDDIIFEDFARLRVRGDG